MFQPLLFLLLTDPPAASFRSKKNCGLPHLGEVSVGDGREHWMLQRIGERCSLVTGRWLTISQIELQHFPKNRDEDIKKILETIS